MQYQHIFFDLDHTLWDFDNNAREALADLYQLLELEKRGIGPFDHFHAKYMHHNTILWDRYHKGYITTEELKWKRMWRTLLDFKIGDEPLARTMSENFLNILPEKKGVFPYTYEILNYLTGKHYQLHLITNGFEKTQWRKLKSAALDIYFKAVVTSERSNSIKPQKEIFDFALLQAGALPAESIMIGDNIDADIAGALNAGWDCIYVNHLQTTATPPATHHITHLKQLESIL